MGKRDNSHPKLWKTTNARDYGMTAPGAAHGKPNAETNCDLKQILVAMQQSLTKMNDKLDDLTFRMDCMSEWIEKNDDCLAMVEQQGLEAEDDRKQRLLRPAHAGTISKSSV
ncbi:hypothetical protein NDU88_003783 [Pleurodeles waltl]|uniref:Uncharacterized protein n=1 Tax=Pleurodeles waltl TaxID=8319 RepID=A0AAV7RDW9_PLEWA|nr:hypothetical protein NDU88_003783 [Pleurodeles waltl]